jgi:transcriptional regulator with XRE-family HTH domain
MPGVARIRPKRPIHVYLRQWREYYGLTQKQLGERLGVDSVSVGRWERQEAGVNLGVLQAIAEALAPDLRYDDLTRMPPQAERPTPPPPANQPPQAKTAPQLRRRG